MKLKRARLADNLNEKIAQRPGPMELVEKNILPVDSTLKQAIRGGNLWWYGSLWKRRAVFFFKVLKGFFLLSFFSGSGQLSEGAGWRQRWCSLSRAASEPGVSELRSLSRGAQSAGDVLSRPVLPSTTKQQAAGQVQIWIQVTSCTSCHVGKLLWIFSNGRLFFLLSNSKLLLLVLSDLGLSNCSTHHTSDLYQWALCVSAICHCCPHSNFKTRPNSGESRSLTFHL